jgi:predicted transcriptional regulator
MKSQKSVSVSFRVSPKFKALLEAAATREHRSQTNMLETLLFQYCAEHEVAEPALDIAKDQKQGSN